MSASVLAEIVAQTRERLEGRKRELPIDRLIRSAPTPAPRRPFAAALARAGRISVIAEFKRRSPSRGVIRDDLGPIEAAQAYETAGAAALSILTDGPFFGGSLDDLQAARSTTRRASRRVLDCHSAPRVRSATVPRMSSRSSCTCASSRASSSP